MIEKRSGSQATWWKQLSTLTKRSFLNMSRDMGYYWVRIIIYLLLSVCVGTIFFNLGTDLNSILARGACAGFISGFMTFLSIGGFPSFLEEMKVKITNAVFVSMKITDFKISRLKFETQSFCSV